MTIYLIVIENYNNLFIYGVLNEFSILPFQTLKSRILLKNSVIDIFFILNFL